MLQTITGSISPESAMGGHLLYKNLLQKLTPQQSTITESLLEAVSSKLTDFGLKPNVQHSDSLRQACCVLSSHLGSDDQTIQVLSLDPGLGKSVLIGCFLELLYGTSSPRPEGSVLLLSRHSEVIDFATKLNSRDIPFSIVTGDDGLNDLSTDDSTSAPVLIMTQQLLGTEGYLRGFDQRTDLYYNGSPRRIRLWDESYTPLEATIVSKDGVSALLKELRLGNPNLTEGLEELIERLSTVDGGSPIEVADFRELVSGDLSLTSQLELLDKVTWSNRLYNPVKR